MAFGDDDFEMEDVDTPMEDDADLPEDVTMEDDVAPAPRPPAEKKASKPAPSRARAQASGRVEGAKKAAKKAAKKKTAKKKKKKAAKDPNQKPSVKIAESANGELEFHEGEYKGHKMFIIYKEGARRMSFGLGKAQKLVEAEKEIRDFVERNKHRLGGGDD